MVKNADFSLVGPDNRASAGDVLVIYATGLGQTTPASATGRLAVFPPQQDTVPVTVTIGGQNAPVVYSIAAPNFAGLYQVAVRMPSGAGSGNVPVVLKAGAATSNSVIIAAQ